jgi:hypothetical protein
MKLSKIFAAVVAVASASSFAADKTPGSGPNPYSDCGIGAAIFSSSPVAAASSNVIWDLGSTALTSATASPETCSANKVAAATFILESYDNLTEDTARGEGEHLTALMNIMEVPAQQQASVIAKLRANMAAQLAQPGYVSADKVAKSTMFFNSAMAASAV